MDDAPMLVLRGACRGLHLAGYFCTFGTMFLAAFLLRKENVPGLKQLAWAGFALAFLAGAAWFLLQTSYFASAQSFMDVANAIPIVAQHTFFGALLLLRLGALFLAVLLLHWNLPRPAAFIGFGGVLAQAWLGHGAAMMGWLGDVLLTTEILHLAAAALWLGTLPALFLGVARLPAPAAIARRYGPLGMVCVGTLLLTALVQYLLLIIHPLALLTTGYGALALVKFLLLLVLVAVAAGNHFRLVPALPATRAALLRAIGAETMLGLLVVVAAGILLQFAPPAMAGMTLG